MTESLFTIKKQGEITSQEVFSAASFNSNYFRKASSVRELVTAIGKLQPGKSVFTFSNGKWSSHDLLAYILQQTGPAKLWFTTWSITEGPLRLMVKLKKDGLLTDVQALIGDRVPVMSPVAWQYASYNLPGIKLSKCHAKVQVIRNADWGVVVMGSANFTNNPRWEAGVVCCDIQVADEYARAIEEAIKSGKNETDTQ